MQDQRPRGNPRRFDLRTAAAIFVASACYFASYAPWTRPVLLDAATWDSLALEVSRGLIPYRDQFLHKTPGAALIGAVGADLGRALGLEPVLVAHAVFLMLGALGPALLYLVCRRRLPVGAALAAAVGLLAWDEWTISALEGCSPKVATVDFGLASMLAAEHGMALVSAFVGGFSVLCWQPGIAFLFGSTAAVFARGERRLSRFALMVLVSVIPAALLLSWFAAHGALGDFFDDSILFNFHYINEKARTPAGTLKALARSLGSWNDFQALALAPALAGLWLARSREERLPVSVAVSGLIYTGMVFVSYQSWPDAILLGPIAATVLGAGLYFLLASRIDARVATALLVLVFALGALPDSRPKFHPPIDFQAQHQRFLALEKGLAPDDRVIAVSVPEFFIHTGRHNGWKWPYLWFGVDDFAADRHPGGFAGILDDLDKDRPALMLVGRIWAGPQRRLFENWAATRYDVETLRLFPHTQRPLRVYRLRR